MRDVVQRFRTVAIVVLVCALTACGGAAERKAGHLAKGREYLAAGSLEKARVEFRNALQVDPNDAEARYENGVVADRLGDVRGAYGYYHGALEVRADYPGASASLGRLLLLLGASDEALKVVEPALLKHPDDPDLLTVRATVRAQNQDLHGGLADAEKAVGLAPGNENAVAVLAGLYNADKRTEKARDLLQSTTQRLPDSVDLRLALAKLYADSGDSAHAETVLKEIVKLRPQEPAHRIRLAQFYAATFHSQEAEQTLRDAIAALPEDAGTKSALIQFLAARKGKAAATIELRAMIARSPEDYALQLELARLYEDSDATNATAIYRKIIADRDARPEGLMARNRLAALLVGQGDTKSAEVLVQQVLATNPRDNDALLMRANLSMANRDPKAAIADLRAVLRDQPDAVGVQRALARAHAANGEPALAEEALRRAINGSPEDTGARIDLAGFLLQHGKPDQAKVVAAELLKREPNNIVALQTMFQACVASSDYAGARSAAATLTATRPDLAISHYLVGMLDEAEGKPADALKSYLKALDVQADAAEPLEAAVRLRMRSNQPGAALALLQAASNSAPKNPLPANLTGDVQLVQKHYAEAEKAYQEASVRSPTWWLPYRGLANVAIAKGNVDAALAVYQKAIANVERRDLAIVEYAALLEKVGRRDDAIQQYEDLLKQSPKSEIAANNLAMLLVTYKTDPQSLARARQLTQSFANSTKPSLLDTYAWVLLKNGNAVGALPIFERLVVAVPDSPVYRYHLGLAQRDAGDSAKAAATLRLALNSGRRFEGSEDARSTLQQLRAFQ